MRLYCNYSNYNTVLFLHQLGANVTVITVTTRVYCNYDHYEATDPARQCAGLVFRHPLRSKQVRYSTKQPFRSTSLD